MKGPVHTDSFMRIAVNAIGLRATFSGLFQVQAIVLELRRLMRPLPLTQRELALASALLLPSGVSRKAKNDVLLLVSCPQRST